MSLEHLRDVDVSNLHPTHSPRLRRWQQWLADPLARKFGRQLAFKSYISDVVRNPAQESSYLVRAIQNGQYAYVGAWSYLRGIDRSTQHTLLQIAISTASFAAEHALQKIEDEIEATIPTIEWPPLWKRVLLRIPKPQPTKEAIELFSKKDDLETQVEYLWDLHDRYTSPPT